MSCCGHGRSLRVMTWTCAHSGLHLRRSRSSTCYGGRTPRRAMKAAIRISTLNGDGAPSDVTVALRSSRQRPLQAATGRVVLLLACASLPVFGCGAIQVVERSNEKGTKWQTYLADCVDACFLDEVTLLFLDPTASMHAIYLTSMTVVSANLPSPGTQRGAPFKILPSASHARAGDEGSARFAVIAEDGSAWLGLLNGALSISPLSGARAFIRTSGRMVSGACVQRSTCGAGWRAYGH